MDLGPAAMADGHVGIHAAAGDAGLLNFLKGQGAQAPGGEELTVAGALQLEIPAGEEIHITKANALKISGMVSADEGHQGLVELLGKILPPGIAGAGEGNEFAGQIHPPKAVGGGELVVDDRLLLLRLHGHAGEPGHGGIVAADILGIFVPDGLLEGHGGFGGDLQDLREAELADDFCKLVLSVNAPGFIGKHGNAPFSFVFSIIPPSAGFRNPVGHH